MIILFFILFILLVII
ncbi:hypothetical protein [Flavicella sediminum]